MAQGLQLFDGALLCDSTGALVGATASNGREYLFATIQNAAAGTGQPTVYTPTFVQITGGTINGTTIGVTTAAAGLFTTLSANAAVTLSPANAAVVLSPTGTGVVTIAPATAGTINNMSIGVTTPAVVKTTDLQAGTFTNISGTPGAGTSSGTRGRAAFAAAASTIVITSALVTATSSIFVQLESLDATLTSVRVTPGAGSFTVTGNAAATAATTFSFLVVN